MIPADILNGGGETLCIIFIPSKEGPLGVMAV
jgi:hypothetical protein